MKVIYSLLIAYFIFSLVSCTKSSDEQKIKNLLQRSTEALNEKDYRTLYEMQTPNSKRRVSYEDYRDYIQGGLGLILLFIGEGEIEISNIEVRVNGQWGYASYKFGRDGEVIDSVDEDIFRKVGGKWYDVADYPIEPGYNRDDLPPEKR